MDRLKKNAVSVVMGNDTIQFIKQPDDTYTAPAGITMTLTKPGGYQLQERHGRTFNFTANINQNDKTYRLETIVDQHGKTMNFAYNASDNRLLTVTDAATSPRTLTFNYTGTPL